MIGLGIGITLQLDRLAVDGENVTVPGGVTWTGVTWTGVTWDGTTPTPQPNSVAVTGPATIVEGTGANTPASVAVTGPATIAEGTTSTPISAAVTGPATIAEGN